MKHVWVAALMLSAYTAAAQTKSQVTGCWVMPSKKGEALMLKPDGNFIFNDYSAMSGDFVKLYGTWSLKGRTVALMYDERKQQRFTLKKNAKAKWTLTKVGGFRFVKSTASDCPE